MYPGFFCTVIRRIGKATRYPAFCTLPGAIDYGFCRASPYPVRCRTTAAIPHPSVQILLVWKTTNGSSALTIGLYIQNQDSSHIKIIFHFCAIKPKQVFQLQMSFKLKDLWLIVEVNVFIMILFQETGLNMNYAIFISSNCFCFLNISSRNRRPP